MKRQIASRFYGHFHLILEFIINVLFTATFIMWQMIRLNYFVLSCVHDYLARDIYTCQCYNFDYQWIRFFSPSSNA